MEMWSTPAQICTVPVSASRFTRGRGGVEPLLLLLLLLLVPPPVGVELRPGVEGDTRLPSSAAPLQPDGVLAAAAAVVVVAVGPCQYSLMRAMSSPCVHTTL